MGVKITPCIYKRLHPLTPVSHYLYVLNYLPVTRDQNPLDFVDSSRAIVRAMFSLLSRWTWLAQHWLTS